MGHKLNLGTKAPSLCLLHTLNHNYRSQLRLWLYFGLLRAQLQVSFEWIKFASFPPPSPSHPPFTTITTDHPSPISYRGWFPRVERCRLIIIPPFWLTDFTITFLSTGFVYYLWNKRPETAIQCHASRPLQSVLLPLAGLIVRFVPSP